MRMRNGLRFGLVVGLSLIFAGQATGADARRAVEKVVPRYKLYLPLEQAFAKLEKLAGVEFTIDWTGLEAAGVSRDARVQLSGKNARLGDILDLLLAQVARRDKPLTWRLAPQAKGVVVTTRARLRLAEAEADRSSVDARPRRQRQRLSRAVRFEEAPLDDVLDSIRKAAGINLHVNWPALASVGVERDTPVTVKVRGVTTAQLLDLVMKELNGDKGRYDSIYWVVDKGVVNVSTGQALNSIMRTKVYDISSLLHVAPDFTSPRIDTEAISAPDSDSGGSGSGGGWGDMFKDEDEGEKELSEAERRAKYRQTVVDIIKNSIGRDMWHPNGKGTIVILRDRLVITQSLLGFKLMEEAVNR